MPGQRGHESPPIDPAAAAWTTHAISHPCPRISLISPLSSLPPHPVLLRRQVRKDVSSHFGADVMSDVGLHVNKGQAIVVGMGKKNPNAMKGRERRGKAKKGSK